MAWIKNYASFGWIGIRIQIKNEELRIVNCLLLQRRCIPVHPLGYRDKLQHLYN